LCLEVAVQPDVLAFLPVPVIVLERFIKLVVPLLCVLYFGIDLVLAVRLHRRLPMALNRGTIDKSDLL
jgi:hypothetical protein